MSGSRVADIIIPTCKTEAEVETMVQEVKKTAAGLPRVLATCLPVCAAANRNAGLEWAETPNVLMVDDDLMGFAHGWNTELEAVLEARPECVMVSAVLCKPNWTRSQMLGNPNTEVGGLVVVPRRELPTACIAIRNNGLRFKEDFIGSGWEDTDYAAQLRLLFPQGTFIVHCGVKVIHANEQKRQAENFYANKARYEAIWGRHPYFN